MYNMELIMPLVTVYITNFNYGRYIKKAIDSVLSQTFQDFELIIIDDGSTDNSKKIIETYSLHPKIKIIFQQNKGLNVTNNIALRVAQGRYIMRLDADDFLDSNALLVMCNLLEKDSELGLIFPDYYLIDEDDNIIKLEKRHSFNNDVSLTG
ncbi:MAG: glycosyltransferase family 2 protein [Bacteroidia bacterium]|nr:glycosyltransferase family 2 protein [Bacteroidia bacterium]